MTDPRSEVEALPFHLHRNNSGRMDTFVDRAAILAILARPAPPAEQGPCWFCKTIRLQRDEIERLRRIEAAARDVDRLGGYRTIDPGIVKARVATRRALRVALSASTEPSAKHDHSGCAHGDHTCPICHPASQT